MNENHKRTKFKDLFFGQSYLGDLGRALLLWVLFIVSMFASFAIVTSTPLASGPGAAIGFLFSKRNNKTIMYGQNRRVCINKVLNNIFSYFTVYIHQL